MGAVTDAGSELAKTLALRKKIGIILGGLPSEQDVLPSVLFITMYAALFAPIFWRIRTHTLTFGQIWKPLLVVMLRISTFAMRIKLTGGQEWNRDVFIAELILLRLGPIILSSAMICLFHDAVLPYLPQVDSPNLPLKLLLKHFVAALNLATYFSLGLTIAIAFDVKQAINGSAEARSKLHRSKEISIWLLVAVDTCIYLLTIAPMVLLHQGRYVKHLVVSKTKEETKFMAVLSVCTFLLVVSAFKAAQLSGHDMGSFSRYNLIVNKKILFYCVCCLGEFVACMLLVTLPWARIVPPPELLEAYCRIHSQNAGEDDAGQPNNNVIPWPNPPPSLAFPVLTNRPEMRQTGGNVRAPEGAYGDQVCGVIPRQATVRSVSVKEEDDCAGGEYDWTDPQFNANQTPPNNIVPLPVQEQNRCTTPAHKRGSSMTLSTISEVGDQTGSRFVDVIANGSRMHGQRVMPKEDADEAHNRSSSLDSLTLPPTLLPHAPPESLLAAAHNSPRRPRALTPHSSPHTHSSPVAIAAFMPPSSVHQPLPVVQEPRLETEAGLPCRPSMRLQTEQLPKSRGPSSACSVRSHWSDDSDEEARNGGHKARFGSLRSKKEAKAAADCKEVHWD